MGYHFNACHCHAALFAVFITAVQARDATAQRRFAAPTIPDSAVSTTAERVYELERLVRRSPNDAAKWHELGMLAWGLEPVVLSGGLPLEKPMRLARVADSSLQTAAMIDAKNARYQMYAANRLLSSKVGITRVGSKKYFKRAVDAARLAKDSELIAASALEYGRTVWWRFESTEHRHQFIGLTPPRSLNDALQPVQRGAKTLEELTRTMLAAETIAMTTGGGAELSLKDITPAMIDQVLAGNSSTDMVYGTLPKNTFAGVRELLANYAKPLPNDLTGWMEYEEGSKLFQESYRAKPDYPGAFRAVAMTYVVRNLWANLERVATTHIGAFRRDSLAWLALGLARYKRGDLRGARAAYDSALHFLGDSERKRLDDWHRILPPGKESLRFPSGGSLTEDLYWKIANPVWSDAQHDVRLEFLSRVAYSELRWTVEEFGIPGADTDRGTIYVRYGPPEKIYGFGTALADDAMDIVQFWVYDNGLIFAFSGMPTFGTMRLPREDMGMVAEMNRLFPVRWENVGAPRIDSLSASAARFRAGPDSLDLAISVDYLNPDSIAQTMSIGGGVQRHLWIASAAASADRHLTGPITSAGPHTWSVRVAPGTMAFRVETFAETAQRAHRGTGVIDATTPEFPLKGTGMSDLLVARQVEGTPSASSRWRDVSFVASTGTIAKGAPLTILWENYELGAREGRAEYDVTLTLKAEKGRAARIRAEIVGVLAALVRADVAPDQVTFTFSRSVQHSAAFADWVTVNIPDAPDGRYTLTLLITDRVSGRTMSRSVGIVIGKQ